MYVCLKDGGAGVVAPIPKNMSFEEAAALPVGGMTALFILQRANIQSGQNVLIYGASGSVGTYAVQLARHFFDATVTGVCSTENIELVKSLGADSVIDYTKEDFTKNGETYDVVFDAVGKTSSKDVRGILNENGSYLSIRTITKESIKDLLILKELVEKGKIQPCH